VERWARRYVCHAPRLSTYLLGLGLYRKEWAAYARAVAVRPELLNPEHWRPTLLGILTTAPDERAGRVLATCVDLVDGKPGDLETQVATMPGLGVDLALACLSLADVSRLFQVAGGPALGTLPVEELEDADLDAVEEPQAAQLLAAIHGVALAYAAGGPMAVMQWPAEVFLDAVEHMAHAKEEPADSMGLGLGNDARIAQADALLSRL